MNIMRFLKLPSIALLLLMITTLSGCQAVQDIFGAGFYTGVFVVVFVIVVIIVIIARIFKKN